MKRECYEHIAEYDRNQKWFIANYKRVLKQYKNRFVAVWHQKIIDTDWNLERLCERLRKDTDGAKGIYIEFATDKPLEMLL